MYAFYLYCLFIMTNRTHVLDGSSSDTNPVSSGVPQGTVLRPLQGGRPCPSGYLRAHRFLTWWWWW